MTYHLISSDWDMTGQAFAVTWPGQVFTYDLRWRPWSRADREEWQHSLSGARCRIRKATRQEAMAAIERIREDVRTIDLARWINRTYRYYAGGEEVVRASLADKNTVAYERFDGRSWVPVGRPDDELTEVEPEDAEEFKQSLGVAEPEPPRPVTPGTESVLDAKSQGYVVTDNASGRLVAMIRANAWWAAGREQVRTYAGVDAWTSSDLLAQIAAGRYDWTARKADDAQCDAASLAMDGVVKRVDMAGWIHHDTKYFFVVGSSDYRTPVYELVGLPRNSRGPTHAICFTDGRWERSFILYDMKRREGKYGHSVTVEVSEADVGRFQAGWYQ